MQHRSGGKGDGNEHDLHDCRGADGDRCRIFIFCIGYADEPLHEEDQDKGQHGGREDVFAHGDLFSRPRVLHEGDRAHREIDRADDDDRCDAGGKQPRFHIRGDRHLRIICIRREQIPYLLKLRDKEIEGSGIKPRAHRQHPRRHDRGKRYEKGKDEKHAKRPVQHALLCDREDVPRFPSRSGGSRCAGARRGPRRRLLCGNAALGAIDPVENFPAVPADGLAVLTRAAVSTVDGIFRYIPPAVRAPHLSVHAHAALRAEHCIFRKFGIAFFTVHILLLNFKIVFSFYHGFIIVSIQIFQTISFFLSLYPKMNK